MKAPSPLLGFNNNVRHKGRVFHIQTEDSGIRHPHIITHLFADGGRILKTTKTSYAEHIGQERLAETVRAMMQEQHKAMFIALRDGQFDYLFEEGGSGPGSVKAPSRVVAPPPPPDLPPPPAPEPPPAARAPEPPPPPVLPEPPPPAAVVAAPVVIPAPKQVVVVPSPAAFEEDDAPPPPRPGIPKPPGSSPGKAPPPRPVMVPRPVAHFAPTEPAQPAAVYEAPAQQTPVQAGGHPQTPLQAGGHPQTPVAEVALPQGSRRRGTSRPTLDVDPGAIHGVGSGEPSIDLDLDALERAAAEAQTPFFQQIQDLPPPPAAVLGSKRASTGGYSVRSPAPPPMLRTPTAPPPPLPRPAAPPPPAPSPGRYAPSRPASIFATTRPQEGASIFGEDLISEKSLDEVILGYLAEDLDGPAEKK